MAVCLHVSVCPWRCSYKQWLAEDFVVVAFAYDPVSNQEKSLFESLVQHARQLPADDGRVNSRSTNPAPPAEQLQLGLGITHESILLLDRPAPEGGHTGVSVPVHKTDVPAGKAGSGNSCGQSDAGEEERKGREGGAPVGSSPRTVSSDQAISRATSESDTSVDAKAAAPGGITTDNDHSGPSRVVSPLPVPSPPSAPAVSPTGPATDALSHSAEVKATSGMRPTGRGSVPRTREWAAANRRAATMRRLSAQVEDRLHRVQSNQIFLGLVAARMMPKHKVCTLKQWASAASCSAMGVCSLDGLCRSPR